ncbi:MAG: hypothetical protein FWE58_00035 [Methanobrevibacter sp.]|nr:hypothetical protein [Methanobrevibacter sp.]
MEDAFFTKLREIQKKERANSILARVGPDFYRRTYSYLDELKNIAENNPFSSEHDLLRNIQRIATEICEIREHKIADAAVLNIQRSYHLFQGKPQFDLLDTTPLNLTDEEEKLYFSLIDTLKSHRQSISFDELSSEDNLVLNDSKNISNEENSIIDSSNIEKKSIEDSVGNDKLSPEFKKLDSSISKLKNRKSEESIDIGKKSIPNIEKSVQNIKKSTPSGETPISSNEKSKLSSINTQKPPENIQSKKSEKFSHEENNKFPSNSNKKELKDKTKINKNSNLEIAKKDKPKIAKNNKLGIDNIIKNESEEFVNIDELYLETDLNLKTQLNKNNSKSTTEKIANVMVLIFSEINSIVGVDKKIYGPFKPQDIVVMPDINANILIKNKKGRLIKN